MIDVSYAMESYWQAALFCKAGEVYNTGGTTSLSVGEFLKILKGLDRVSLPSRVDPKLL